MKKTKLFVMGKRLKDIYPHASKWQVFKYKVRKFFRKVFLLGFAIGVIVLAVQIGRYAFPVIEDVPVVGPSMAEKVEQMKMEIVHTIRDTERAGYGEDDGIIIFDTNKQMSIGTYQYQKKTVIYYYKKLYGKEITPKEAVLIALDDKKAEQLTYDIIFGEPKGWSNWYNTSKKHDLEGKIAVIKELTK
jgi:hypothetical protein